MSEPNVDDPAGRSHTLGVLQAHAATVLFGLAGLFGKWIAAPALVVAGLRTLVAAACFALLLAAWPRLRAAWPRLRSLGPDLGAGAAGNGRREALLAAVAGVVLGTHWWLFFEAIQVSTVAVALLAYSTAPGFVAILEPLLHRRAPAPAALLASGAVLAGVAWMVPRWTLDEAAALGAAWGVGAGLLFAILMLLNRRLVPVYGPVRLSFYLNLGASAVLLPWLPGIWVPLSGADWGLVLVLGIAFTVGAHTLFIGSLQRLPAHTAAIISALEPVYGIVGAAALLGEKPSLRTLAGGAVILGAVLWVTSRPARGE